MAEKPKITILLLNYKRPQNIPIILDAISKQTIKATIFLWNNGEDDVSSPMIERYVQSEKNVGCMARWMLAKEATTPYVMSLDDDICFSENDGLERVVRAVEAVDNPNRIVGFSGASFDAEPSYHVRHDYLCRHADTERRTRAFEDHYHMDDAGNVFSVKYKLVSRDEPVDIVKGRVMAFRRCLLTGVQLPNEREDDIYLSAAFSNGSRGFHRIPVSLNDAFYELPEFGVANWTQPGHMPSRDRAVKSYFSKVE